MAKPFDEGERLLLTNLRAMIKLRNGYGASYRRYARRYIADHIRTIRGLRAARQRWEVRNAS